MAEMAAIGDIIVHVEPTVVADERRSRVDWEDSAVIPRAGPGAQRS